MLSRVAALHTAARRYCSERSDLCRDHVLEYPVWDEEFVILRRHCCVLDAIGDAMETFTPADSASLDEVRKLLLAAAAIAVNNLPRSSGKSYASHEDTVTIAGAELLSGLRAAWPAWRSFVPDWA